MRALVPLVVSALATAGCHGTDAPPCGRDGMFVVAGLSAVEAPPAVPTQVELLPNPLLIDGDTSASAGLDLGYGPTAAGDTAMRDVGVQLESGAAVDLLHLWVDRSLPPEVARAYAFAAYRSDDNASWTPVAAAGPAAFSPIANRFELPIARTSAPYVKVVTRPLGVGVTADPAFREVFVTELESLRFDVCNAGP